MVPRKSMQRPKHSTHCLVLRKKKKSLPETKIVEEKCTLLVQSADRISPPRSNKLKNKVNENSAKKWKASQKDKDKHTLPKPALPLKEIDANRIFFKKGGFPDTLQMETLTSDTEHDIPST